MPSFKPSAHSYGCSYGDCGCTAISYGDAGGAGAKGGGIASTQAVARQGSGAVNAGTYSDAEGYSYSVSANSIVIYKKSGSVWKTLTPSDSLWDTIVGNLTRDMEEGKLRAGKATPRASAGSSSSASASTDPGPELAEDPFYKKSWFPVAVVGGIAFVGLLTYALWPSKS